MRQQFLPCLNQLTTVNRAQLAINRPWLRYDVSPIRHRSITRNNAALLSIDRLHKCTNAQYDDVFKWKHVSRYWPFVRRIHWPPVNYPHKGQWRGALMFSLICAWMNGWLNNCKAGDLRRHNAHYDVTVMFQYITMNHSLDLCAYFLIIYNVSFVGNCEDMIPILILHFLMPFDIINMAKGKRKNKTSSSHALVRWMKTNVYNLTFQDIRYQNFDNFDLRLKHIG